MVNLEIESVGDPKGEIQIAEQVEAFKEALNIRIEAALDAYSTILLDKLADLTPVDTGETALSWEVFHSGVWQLFITNSNEPVSTFLSEGTTDHWVEPVTAKALHWVGPGGQDFFSKGHMVSGIKAMHIELRALEETEDDLIRLVDEAERLAFDDAFEKSANVQSPQLGGTGVDMGGDSGADIGEGEGEF